MRITRKQLRQIIQEETGRLQEASLPVPTDPFLAGVPAAVRARIEKLPDDSPLWQQLLDVLGGE